MDDYQLFVDLDGVLVDFNSGVRQATGKEPSELHPRQMWPVLAKTPGFYNRLDWMEDGRQLWNTVRSFDPAILTGLPMGRWAEAQKRQWCERELGPDVPVITGMSRKKAELALQWMEENGCQDKIPVLIDDRLRIREPWEAVGGRFVLHLNTETTLRELTALGYRLP